MGDEELERLIEPLATATGEIRTSSDETKKQLDRIDASLSGTNLRVDLLAVDVRHATAEMRQATAKSRQTTAETHALIRFSHAALDRRIRNVEQLVSDLHVRVARLEVTTQSRRTYDGMRKGAVSV